MAGRQVERPVHTKPVALAGGDVRQIGMPDMPVHLVKRDPRLDAVLSSIEGAKLDLLRRSPENNEKLVPAPS